MRLAILILALFLPFAAYTQDDLRARSAFVEGEDFTPVGADWRSGQGWSDDIYTATSGDAVLANDGGKGEATRDVTIPADGVYNVWVRYLRINTTPGSFGLRVVQGGQTVFDQEYHASPQGTGWEPEWEKFEANLKAGPANLTLYIAKPGIRQRVDCVLITSDLKYEKPNYRDFAPQVFMRLKLLEPAVPVSANLRTYCKREPVYYYDPGRINAAGLGKQGDEIAPGAWSPWIELSKFMDSGHWQTTVKLRYATGPEPLPRVKAQYQLATTPAEADAVTLDEDVEGDLSSLVLPGDIKKFPEIVILASALTARHLARAKELKLPPPGEAQLPMEVHLCGYGDSYNSRLMLEQELTVARMLGGNSFNDFHGAMRQVGEKVGFRRGFLHQWFTYKAWQCPTNPDMAKLMDEHFKAAADKLLKNDPEVFERNYRNTLYDEPGTSDMKHLRECPSCLAAFPPYLAQQGFKPQDFGRENWDGLKPLTRDEATDPGSRKLHYWSIQFRDWTNACVVKAGTDAAEQHFGKQILNMINFTDGPLSGWAHGLTSGPDWFMYGRMRSVSLMWSEDWATLGPEVSGYITSMLRAAGRPNNLPVGEYIIANNNPTLMQRAFSALMHGARNLHFYCYGPYYAFADGMISDNLETQRTLAATTNLITKADPYLYPAQVQPAQVAILYGKSHEIWQPDSALNTERRTTYLACQHAHVPVDMVSEQDLADGLLTEGKYRVLYLSESNVLRAAAQKIAEWVKAGGVLQMGAGAGRFDEYNEPLTELLDLAGVQVSKVEQPASDYREHYGIPHQTPRGEIELAESKLWPASKLPLLGYTEESQPAGAEVIAAFADGKPAAFQRQAGKGTVLRYAFMPGLAYVKTAKPEATQVITGYDPALLRVLTAGIALAQLTPPLSVSEQLVEASLLKGPKADVVVLANWSRQDLPAVQVTVRGGKARKVTTASGAPVKVAKVKDNLVLSVPLGPAEVIVLHK